MKRELYMSKSWFKLGILIVILILYFKLFPAYADIVVNDITQLNPTRVDQIIVPRSTQEVSQAIANHSGPICIGGGRYSQGGQIATNNCLFLDMRGMNKILEINSRKQQITVEAGATWRKIQEAIDPDGLAIEIMQSYSNFTVGGSLSVNAHGRYVGEGPIIRSVESIKIVLADGSVKTASRTINPELFYGAIGGYGGIGVITEATLDLVPNTPIEQTCQTMEISKYKNYFFHIDSKTAVFHNANIYPPDYTQVEAVTWSITNKAPTIKDKLAPQNKLTLFQQFLLSWISDYPFGKFMRQHIYDPYKCLGNVVKWRNYEASYDVNSLEPPSRKKSTYVLQEYFIPVKNFDEFVQKMKNILKMNQVNVINISVRHALPDPGTLLAWARQEVFSFVIYYKQDVTETAEKAVYIWTRELINAALEEGGTYYLAYQIIATPEQFMRAYPNAQDFFALKKRVDPTYKFRNKLWDRYYDVGLDSQMQSGNSAKHHPPSSSVMGQ